MAITLSGDGISSDAIASLAASKLTGTVPDANAPSGSVIQVVQTVFTNALSSSSTTFADTGMSATITPISTSSKILVLVNHGGVSKNVGDANNAVKIRLLRDSTVIFSFANLAGFTNTNSYNVGHSVATSFLDSPSTVSAVTYKTQFANYSNTSSIEINANGDDSTITLMEIAG